MEFHKWCVFNMPAPQMFFYGPAVSQFQGISGLLGSIGVEGVVRDTHFSKSVELPIVSIFSPQGYVGIRGNFHGWFVSFKLGKEPEGLVSSDHWIPNMGPGAPRKSWVEGSFSGVVFMRTFDEVSKFVHNVLEEI